MISEPFMPVMDRAVAAVRRLVQDVGEVTTKVNGVPIWQAADVFYGSKVEAGCVSQKVRFGPLAEASQTSIDFCFAMMDEGFSP